MERKLRDKDLVIPMPSLAGLSSMLSPMKALALEGSIETHSREYRKTIKQYAYENPPSEFVAFTIPLDSYLPLPEAYGSIVHEPQEQSATMTLVHHTALETKVGTEKLTAVLTALVVAIGNKDTVTPLSDLDETTIMGLYSKVIRQANNTIMAYKLTPGRHNHDLQPVTITDRPSYVDIFRFDTRRGEILEAGTVHMHQNLLASVERARHVLNGPEHTDFRNYFQMIGLHGDNPAANILATMYQAIDEVCTGNFSSGLVLADTYAEHSMRYALLQLYANEGHSEEAAMGKVDSLRTLEKLLGGLAAELHVTRPNLKQMISFDTWRDACRQKRNHITHRFTKLPVEPHEARTALHETIHMITKLTRHIMRTHVELAPHLRLFGAPSWYIGSIEDYDEHDGQSIGRVEDIITYKYLNPKDLPDPS